MLLDQIANIAVENPNRVAVVADGETATYKELHRRVNELAARLRHRGMNRGDLVAIYLARSVDLVVALLAVMRSEGAYSIVEEDGNADEHIERLRSMKPKLTITSVENKIKLNCENIPSMSIEHDDMDSFSQDLHNNHAAISTDNIAYVLFTSGSTGIPKGVAVTHRNIIHYTTSLLQYLNIKEPLAYGHVSTLSADLGNTCLFLSLWTGGELHLLDARRRRDPEAFLTYIRSHKIDVLKITPSHWRVISQGRKWTKKLLRFLILGGEQLSITFAKTVWNAKIADTLVNHYGPTEATVGVAAHVIRSSEDLDRINGESVPIGSAFGLSSLLVRGDDGTFHERNAFGELYIGGPSVANGYFNNHHATTDAFVTGIKDNMRFYKTGDLVRVDENSVFEFVGRRDRQVKVSGYRVELEHVESVLRNIPRIDDAAIYFLSERGRGELVAAVKPRLDTTQMEIIKLQLSTIIPKYMIPARMISFEQFPLNENGKIDRRTLQIWVKEAFSPIQRSIDVAPTGTLEAELASIWENILNIKNPSLTCNFFDAGGDSLAAIQVISELQIRGHQISASTFTEAPTIASLAAAIRKPGKMSIEKGETLRESLRFSASQRDFLNTEMKNRNHWNQVVLFSSECKINPEIFTSAVAELVHLHPLLYTSYCNDEEDGSLSWRAKIISRKLDDILTLSYIDSIGGEVSAYIERKARELNVDIDIANGRIFRVHLFKNNKDKDYILFVCHHLSVDVISWKIILEDLDRIYGALLNGDTPTTFHSRCSFWDWVRHIHQSEDMLRPNLKFWNIDPSHEKKIPFRVRKENIECTSRSCWFALSREETAYLLRQKRSNARPHAAVLAAFAVAYAARARRNRILVDVESHGRLSFADRLDPSRLVGWFTSTYPIVIEIGEKTPPELARDVDSTLASVPQLGLAYSMFSKTSSGASPLDQPTICYNYLGALDIGNGDVLGLSPSPYYVGPARGNENDRVYDFKLSARVLDHRLVADLSFSTAYQDGNEMLSLMAGMKRVLLKYLDDRDYDVAVTGDSNRCADKINDMSVILDEGSSTGVLTYVPPALRLDNIATSSRNYDTILLTGATGFIGCHVLHELLCRTQATIYCIIRPKSGETARRRLESVYQYYFRDLHFESYRDRCVVLAGDVTLKYFGLPAVQYEWLAENVDAIYHFAADTKLFGSRSEFEVSNVLSVKNTIDLAQQHKQKHLHYMSTLAVSGVNRNEKKIIFSEDMLDISQAFQNEYEYSKFSAEKLMYAFMHTGGDGFIYRSGNVSGHSHTALFQRNASENRLIQLLSAVAKVGLRSDRINEQITLSPVDLIAKGVVTLSLDSKISKGTFHVDSHHKIDFKDIFDVLEELGVPLGGSNASTFSELFHIAEQTNNPVLTLASFWASRPSRNIEYDNSRTLRLLASRGVHFTPLGTLWLKRFIERLIVDGVLYRNESVANSEPFGK